MLQRQLLQQYFTILWFRPSSINQKNGYVYKQQCLMHDSSGHQTFEQPRYNLMDIAVHKTP